MIICTFKIQSAEVVLDIEGQIYGEWILPLVHCLLLIREFVSTFLFTKSRSHCKKINMIHGVITVSKHELSMKYLLNLSRFCSVHFSCLATQVCSCVVCHEPSPRHCAYGSFGMGDTAKMQETCLYSHWDTTCFKERKIFSYLGDAAEKSQPRSTSFNTAYGYILLCLNLALSEPSLLCVLLEWPPDPKLKMENRFP